MIAFLHQLTPQDYTLIFFSLFILLVTAYPLGLYCARVLSGERVWLSYPLGFIERGLYAFAGVSPSDEMNWKRYAAAVLSFSLCSFLFLFALLRLQGFIAFGPYQAFPSLSSDLAFNTAVSFVTNTNWQAYLPETMISPVVQAIGLAVQNFLSCAVGMGVLAVLARGFVRKKTDKIGNFWVDCVRATLYILLPLSFVLALLLVSEGVVQSFAPLAQWERIIPFGDILSQEVPLGAVASQVAIKQLGANGGGFYGANSAHPFENPTALSNLFEFLAILLIPSALCLTFGKMVGNLKQGVAILAAMVLIFTPLMFGAVFSEQQGNPQLSKLGITQAHAPLSSGGNMEGKEVRFGVVNSAMWAAATTASSNGSTNAALDSFTPLGGFVPLLLMQFGDVIFGGAGTGLCSMLVYVLLTVFSAGLMVGRTPEFLAKKIGPFDMKMICLAILFPHLAALIGTAISVVIHVGKIGATNPYAQGFSEILYAFSSAANNNGSSFGGLEANSFYYNTALGLAMLVGRYCVIIPILALAGSMAVKGTVPSSAGTLRTDTPLFVFILVCIVLTVGVLTFVPALALGPLAEHFHMVSGV